MKISGSKLRTARLKTGIERSELAEVADLTVARIWQIEMSNEVNVNANVLNAMAERLGTTADELAA